MGDTRVTLGVGERAAATAFSNAVIGRLIGEIEKKYKIWKGLSHQSLSLQVHLNNLAHGMDDELVKCGGAPRTAVARAYGQEMRTLTHDIEDCLERFLHRVTCKEGASRLHRMTHCLKSFFRCFRFAAEIRALKRRLQEAGHTVFNPPGGREPSSTPSAPRPAPVVYVENPVGIDEAVEELACLLEQPNRLTLISISGFGGSGKTTLARAVCNRVEKSFTHYVWISISSLEHSDALGILTNLQDQLLPDKQLPLSLPNLTEVLVKNPRYLIVFDGLKEQHVTHWDTIRTILKGCGGVLVTTTSQIVANACVSRSQESRYSQTPENTRIFGYIYNMKPLCKEDSLKIALPHSSAPELLQGSVTLLEKCDGHPLALSCVANHLSCQAEPTGKFCMDLCSNVGSYLAWDGHEEPNFFKLRSVLFESFNGLPDHFLRTCMLYLGIFPVDRPLRRSVIARRWCAEGYTRSDPGVSEQKVADKYFKKLVEQNIIQPVGSSRNSLVKTCKTHGIIHAFMLHKSVSENFIATFDAERVGTVRHLVVHNSGSTDAGMTPRMDLSRVRSLTAFGNGGAAISDFSKYKLIRVLDLEDCSDLRDTHLNDICKLWNLRYLSLGPSITSIPREIAKLKLLETLDVSKTKVNVLPWVVIDLPGLVHLIGKFALKVPAGFSNIKHGEKVVVSKLETIAGFVSDGSPGILQLLVHMKNLSKVKIWCDYTGEGNDFNNELYAFMWQYLQGPVCDGSTRSLSLDFQAVPDGTMYALREVYNLYLHAKTPLHLSSLKLRGHFTSLPEVVPVLMGLTELCLSPTSVTQSLISALGKMECLLYLTITTDHVDHFIIQKRTFVSLRRLRFVITQNNFIFPEVQEGALPHLVSLQLLCRGLTGNFEIKNLGSLKELVLDSGVSTETRRSWEEACRQHANMPSILIM